MTSLDIITKLHNSRILVVDDSPTNCMFLEKMLRMRGFDHILCAGDAEAALKAVRSYRPDLVILDIVMPGMDGFNCCQAIREMPGNHALPVLIQTVISEPELRFKAFKVGASDFITKPVYPDELYARMLVHLEKKILLGDLERYKRRIEVEMESACALQQSMLPSAQDLQDAQAKSHLEIASYFRPSSEIGGDFWGIRTIPSGGAFWMVDFSGHGVAAALNAFRFQAFMREDDPLADNPGAYLGAMNDRLLPLLPTGQFATMFYGMADTKAHMLSYACAGAPHPLMLRNDGNVEIVNGTGKPLGIEKHFYHAQRMDFRPGDIFFLYSDTMLETCGEYYPGMQEQDIANVLRAHSGASPKELLSRLLEAFTCLTGSQVRDDLTLCLFRHYGSA